jgi:hypothetical protein
MMGADKLVRHANNIFCNNRFILHRAVAERDGDEVSDSYEGVGGQHDGRKHFGVAYSATCH